MTMFLYKVDVICLLSDYIQGFFFGCVTFVATVEIYIYFRDGHHVRSTVYMDGTYRYGHLPVSLAICDPTVRIRCSDWPSWTVFYG